MSEFRRTTPDDLYFVTLTIMGWIALFNRTSNRDIIVNSLKRGQERESLEIFCYVIMSNHLHMICRRVGSDLKEFIGRFKSFTAKEMIKSIQRDPREIRKEWMLREFRYFAQQSAQYKDFHIWHYTDYPILLYNNQIIDQKRDYIHNNPVHAGIVTDPSAYLYSSACPDSPLKVMEL